MKVPKRRRMMNLRTGVIADGKPPVRDPMCSCEPVSSDPVATPT
jgi:hypothetical protein